MRIAIAVSTFPPYRGGMGNVAADQARELAALGHNVNVYTPIVGEPTVEQREGYSVHFVRAPISIGNAAFLPQLYAIGKENDAVLLHYPFMGGAEAAALARHWRGDGAKLVIYYHMDLVGQPPRDQLFAWYTRLFMPGIIRSADRLVVSSSDYAMTGALRAVWQRLPARRLMELPPAVDTEFFSPGLPSPGIRERHHLPAGMPLLLFVGGLDTAHYFKGVEVLMRAVTHVIRTDRPCALLVVGDGDLRPRYEEMAHSLGIVEHVRFAGNAPRAELADIYRAADALCLPSVDRSEAFGMVCLEAMACGKPVIASRLPGVRTVVLEGETGFLVEPADVQGLARALSQLFADPARAAALGRAGRARVEAHYSLPTMRAGLKRLFDDVQLP